MTHLKRLATPLLIGIFLLTFINVNLTARIVANASGTAFEEDTESAAAGARAMATGNVPIENIVIEGAGYFLDTYSKALILLNKIEMSDLKGVNFEELQDIAEAAVTSMENTKITYTLLTERAGQIPYNKETLEKLYNFDYSNLKRAHRLNADIFRQVTSYLKNGDVRGAYYRMQLETEELLSMLNDIKTSIDGFTVPKNFPLWRLNQKFSESILFGQYLAEVFQRL